jgi:hypothetical protein
MKAGSKISKQDLKDMIYKIELTAEDITNLKNSEYIKKMLEKTKNGNTFVRGECALLYALKNDKWAFLEATFNSKHKGALFDYMLDPSKGVENIKTGESPFCYLIRMKQWNIVAAFIKDLKQTQIETLYSHYATGEDHAQNESIMHYVIKSLDTDYLKKHYKGGFIQLSLDKKTVLTSFYQLFSEIQPELNLNPKNKEGHSPLSLAIMLSKHAQYILEIISFFKEEQLESILNDSYGKDRYTIYDLLEKSEEASYETYYFITGETPPNEMPPNEMPHIKKYVLEIGGKNSTDVSNYKLGQSSDKINQEIAITAEGTSNNTTEEKTPVKVETPTSVPIKKTRHIITEVDDVRALSSEVPQDKILEKQNTNSQHKKTLESKRNYAYLTKTILGGLAGLGLAYYIVHMMTISSVFLTTHLTLMAISLTIIGAALGFSNAYLNDNLSAEIVKSKEAHEAFEEASANRATRDNQEFIQGELIPTQGNDSIPQPIKT